MARKSERVGRGKCPMCGDRVTFHRTAGGALNYECEADDCGHSAYAHRGSACERDWLASIERAAAPAPVPAVEPMTPEKANAIGQEHDKHQARLGKNRPALLIG